MPKGRDRLGKRGTNRPTQGRRNRRGGRARSRTKKPEHPRDVKNEGTSGDVHENKVQVTICQPQKSHFLPGCTPFYTELHRSEEHTSELQSLRHLVCRLL